PVGPGAGEPVEHLLGRRFADRALRLGHARQRLAVGCRAPKPRRDRRFLDLLQARRDARLAEIFLRQHVGGDLPPERPYLHVVRPEHHRTVRVADLARGQAEFDVRIRRLSVFGVAPLDPHFSSSSAATDIPAARTIAPTRAWPARAPDPTWFPCLTPCID